MGYGVAVFLVCQTGQKIRDEVWVLLNTNVKGKYLRTSVVLLQTCDIQDAVYASKWYIIDPKLAQDMKLILLRCQKPVFMEAVPFGIFNYNLS